MGDEETLRARAREALRTGRLPDRPPEHIWGGPGMGARCAVCVEPIGRNESELELQFAEGCEGEPTAGSGEAVRSPGSGEPVGGQSGEGSCHVHVRCFAAWELERGAASNCRRTDGRAS